MEIIKNLLTPNKYSRPQRKLENVTKIAVHYVGNPGSSAEGNRNYFESLKVGKSYTTKNGQKAYLYASSHYIIGLKGEIMQCIPEEEWAYCTNAANKYSISIECCHPASDGKFTNETYNSLVELCADLCIRYELNPLTDLIRHYEITKKICPKWFVDNPKEWDLFKLKVKEKIDEINKPIEIIKEVLEMFKDSDLISSWAKIPAEKLKELGIMNGDNLGNFNPKQELNREQLATVIYNLLKYLGKV